MIFNRGVVPMKNSIKGKWVRILNPFFYIGCLIAIIALDCLSFPLMLLSGHIIVIPIMLIISILIAFKLIDDLHANCRFKAYKVLDRRDLYDFLSLTHVKMYFKFGTHDDVLIKVNGSGRFDFVSKLDDSLSEAMGMDLVSKFQSDDNSYIYDFSLYGTKQLHMKKSKPMGAYVGDTGHKVIMLSNDLDWDFSKYPHCLIAGKTGSGKSVALFDLIIPQLLASGCEIHVSDIKQEHMFDYVDFNYPGTIDFCSTSMETLKMLRNGLDEVKKRQKAIYDYQKENEGKKPNLDSFFTNYFLIIDELQTVSENSKERKELVERVTRLVQLARSVHVYVIVSVQVASVSNGSSALSGEARSQFGLRLLCGDNSRIVEREMFDSLDRELKHTGQIGEAYARIDGMPGNAPRRILLPYFENE